MKMKTFEEMMLDSYKVTDQNPVDEQFHSDNPKSSIKKVWFFDVPDFVEVDIAKLWMNYELGNDNYIYKYDPELSDEFKHEYPYVYGWLKHKGIDMNNEHAIIYWWL